MSKIDKLNWVKPKKMIYGSLSEEQLNPFSKFKAKYEMWKNELLRRITADPRRNVWVWFAQSTKGNDNQETEKST